jgi:hypothetical protein
VSVTPVTPATSALQVSLSRPPDPLASTDASTVTRLMWKWIMAASARQRGQEFVAQQQAAAAQLAAQQVVQQQQVTTVPTVQPSAPQASSPGGWQAVAICEEGGANDYNYGYYGIKEWNGFDGYPTAGSAPQSVQLQWEAQNIGAPPDESGGCHSY